MSVPTKKVILVTQEIMKFFYSRCEDSLDEWPSDQQVQQSTPHMACSANHSKGSGHGSHSQHGSGLIVGPNAWLQRKVHLRPQHRGVHLVTEEILRGVSFQKKITQIILLLIGNFDLNKSYYFVCPKHYTLLAAICT